MPSESLIIIEQEKYKIYVSCYMEELEKLKKESRNTKDSFIFFDECGTYNYLFLD